MTPEKPVVLLHGDNYIRRRDGMFKPRDHGRILCLAAAELLRRDAVSYVVIPGGLAASGPDQPPSSEPMREQIMINLAHNPVYEHRVISLGSGRNTQDEVTYTKRFAGLNGWDNFLDIIPEGQVLRGLRIALKHLGRNVRVNTAEETLVEATKRGTLLHSLARKAVEKHRSSREYRWYAYRHRRLNRIEAFPGGIMFVALLSKLLRDKAKTESEAPDWFK